MNIVPRFFSVFVENVNGPDMSYSLFLGKSSISTFFRILFWYKLNYEYQFWILNYASVKYIRPECREQEHRLIQSCTFKLFIKTSNFKTQNENINLNVGLRIQKLAIICS